MTPQEQLFRAAEKIDADKNVYCCQAIGWSEAGRKAQAHFKDMFEPGREIPGDGDYRRIKGAGASFWNKGRGRTPERKQLRVLALLFAAESFE